MGYGKLCCILIALVICITILNLYAGMQASKFGLFNAIKREHHEEYEGSEPISTLDVVMTNTSSGDLLSPSPIILQLRENLNLSICKSIINESNLHFMNEDERKKNVYRFNYPPLLPSHGGSGNTLTRLIIEYITNIWTGAIYYDSSLVKAGFLGEGQCFDIATVKVHPEFYIRRIPKSKEMNKKDVFTVPCLKNVRRTQMKDIDWNTFKPKYHDIDNKHRFLNMSAIFIIRDPYKAIFAEYMLLNGKTYNNTNLTKHTSHIKLEDWNKAGFCKKFKLGPNQWFKTFKFMDIMTKMGHEYITVIFERLVNLKQPLIAINEMRKIARYLFSDTYFEENEEMIMNRIICLVNELMPIDFGRFGKVHRDKVDPNEYLTWDIAYNYFINHCSKRESKEFKQMAHFYGYLLPEKG